MLAILQLVVCSMAELEGRGCISLAAHPISCAFYCPEHARVSVQPHSVAASLAASKHPPYFDHGEHVGEESTSKIGMAAWKNPESP